MRKVYIGLAAIIGVVVGILLAPRKGSETRGEIVRRSKPIPQAARKAVSKAGEAIAPATDKAAGWIPLVGKDKGDDNGAVDAREPVGAGKVDRK